MSIALCCSAGINATLITVRRSAAMTTHDRVIDMQRRKRIPAGCFAFHHMPECSPPKMPPRRQRLQVGADRRQEPSFVSVPSRTSFALALAIMAAPMRSFIEVHRCRSSSSTVGDVNDCTDPVMTQQFSIHKRVGALMLMFYHTAKRFRRFNNRKVDGRTTERSVSPGAGSAMAISRATLISGNRRRFIMLDFDGVAHRFRYSRMSVNQQAAR